MEEKEVFQRIMRKQLLPGPLRDQLKELKIRSTYGNAILFQMVRKAAEGDLSAAKYILGVVQEEPEAETDQVDLTEVSTEELRKMMKAAEGG